MSFPGFPLPIGGPVPPVRGGKSTTGSARHPGDEFHSARGLARQWADGLAPEERMAGVQALMIKAVAEYSGCTGKFSVTPAAVSPSGVPLDFAGAAVAAALGKGAGTLDVISAAYWLSAAYISMLPDDFRSRLGVYYTPPALSARLLEMAANAGTDWTTCRVLDPACGGGAFLVPVALKMAEVLRRKPKKTIMASIVDRVRGFEIDPFAAWLTQAFLEIALSELRNGEPIPNIVKVCDSLDVIPSEKFDLVIGNPPYGRVGLPAALRARYKRSLYGHANLYGVFTDLAIRWTTPGGVIAYVTPTSFLAGEYFKALRSLLAREAPPVAINFVEARKGVFEGVLQETMLATYRAASPAQIAPVQYVSVTAKGEAIATPAGHFCVPEGDPTAPWLMPREPNQAALIARLRAMKSRLSDWGYRVSTGPLVWNRHKDQLRASNGKGRLPLIWAECLTGSGQFVFRADKKNHEPYFEPAAGDEWLIINRSCVLLQRTTAKEQTRRLIAAALPESLIEEYGGVVVENHLNMIRPASAKPAVPPEVLAAVMNSRITDLAFRCISGSVAVSAFELENLPLPSPKEIKSIELLLRRNADSDRIERQIQRLYFGEETA